MTNVHSIWRFPVKGMTGQKLDAIELVTGSGIKNDRRFAVTRGTQDTGTWMPARSFYINATTDNLPSMNVGLTGTCLSIASKQGGRIEVDIDEPDFLETANTKISDVIAHLGIDPNVPAPKLVQRTGAMANWDYTDTPISIINAETVRAISKATGVDLDPLRFRGNIIVDDLPPWGEFGWMGQKLKIGDAEIEIHRPIDRCPTPGVNPQTGERDVPVTQTIQDSFGHIFCGMYAKVVRTGQVNMSDPVEVLGEATMTAADATAPDNSSDYRLWPRTTQVTSYEVDAEKTRITLQSATPWPLPKAAAGQRLRLHLGQDEWTSQYIVNANDKQITLEVTDSKTSDPITQKLRHELAENSTLIVSGPFGKA